MELLIDSRLTTTYREGLTRLSRGGQQGRHVGHVARDVGRGYCRGALCALRATQSAKSSTEATEHSLVLSVIASHGQPAQRGERVKVRGSVVLFGAALTSSERARRGRAARDATRAARPDRDARVPERPGARYVGRSYPYRRGRPTVTFPSHVVHANGPLLMAQRQHCYKAPSSYLR